MTIWEIDRAIAECIDFETGEILSDQLEKLEMEREQKLKNIAQWIVNEKANAEAYKTQKMHFADLQKTSENRVKSLEAFLSNILNGQKWEADDKSVKATFRKSESVEVAEGLDMWKVPERFIKTQDPVINKEEAKKYLKAGNTIEGITLVENLNITVK